MVYFLNNWFAQMCFINHTTHCHDYRGLYDLCNNIPDAVYRYCTPIYQNVRAKVEWRVILVCYCYLSRSLYLVGDPLVTVSSAGNLQLGNLLLSLGMVPQMQARTVPPCKYTYLVRFVTGRARARTLRIQLKRSCNPLYHCHN